MQTIRIDSQDVIAALTRAGDQILPLLAPHIMSALLLLEREAKEFTPTASGLTRNSIGAREPEILGDEILGVVASSSPHIEYLELGTRPHRPPIEPIEDWVQLKLGLTGIAATRVAHAIANKIARVGTEGAFMFQKAFERNESQVQDMLDRGVTQALRDVGLLQ